MSSGPLTMIKAREEMLGNMSRNKTKGKRRRCQSARAGGDSIRGGGGVPGGDKTQSGSTGRVLDDG